jgi:hypothetical protein
MVAVMFVFHPFAGVILDIQKAVRFPTGWLIIEAEVE